MLLARPFLEGAEDFSPNSNEPSMSSCCGQLARRNLRASPGSNSLSENLLTAQRPLKRCISLEKSSNDFVKGAEKLVAPFPKPQCATALERECLGAFGCLGHVGAHNPSSSGCPTKALKLVSVA